MCIYADVSVEQEEESTANYEPVVQLSDADKVETKTHEEDEEVTFKM